MELDWTSTRAMAATIDLMWGAMDRQLPTVLIGIVTSYVGTLGLEIVARLAQCGERNLSFRIDGLQNQECTWYHYNQLPLDIGLRFVCSELRCSHVLQVSDAVLWDFACGEPLPQELIDGIDADHAAALTKDVIDVARERLRGTIEAVAEAAGLKS